MSTVSPELDVVETEPVVEEVAATEEVVTTEPVVEEVAQEEVTGKKGKKAKKAKKCKKEKPCKKEKKAKKAKKEKPCKKEKTAKKCKCKKAKGKKNYYPVLSLFLTVVTLALAFVMPTYAIGPGNKLVEGVSIVEVALGVFKLSSVPVINNGVVSLVYSAALMCVFLALACTVVLTVACFASKKNAKYFARANAVINLVVFFFVSMVSMCSYRYLTNKANAIELASLVIAGVNGVAYIVMNAKDYKKDAFLPTVLCGLSFANVLYYLYSTVYMNKKLTIAIMGRSVLHAAMYLGIICFVSLIFFYSLVAMSKKKTTAIDLLVYIANLIFTLGVMFFGFCVIEKMRPYALSLIASLVVAVIQIIVCAISINYGKLLAKVSPVAEEVAEAPVEETVVEETVVEATEETAEEVAEETVMEETADVEGVVAEAMEEVLEAETVTEDVAVDELPEANYVKEPAVEEEPKLTFASSYMKAKESTPTAVAFDWFLESLTPEEKAEFTELFVYKYLGGTAVLPDYVPGGNNYEFFRAFFVNLGKYRNRISDTLIEKMYQYMIKKY